MNEMTRDEHLVWCKRRAMEYVAMGDLPQAFASMGSDLQKHPETKGHSGITIGTFLLMNGRLSTQEEMRSYINGFH